MIRGSRSLGPVRTDTALSVLTVLRSAHPALEFFTVRGQNGGTVDLRYSSPDPASLSRHFVQRLQAYADGVRDGLAAQKG